MTNWDSSFEKQLFLVYINENDDIRNNGKHSVALGLNFEPF